MPINEPIEFGLHTFGDLTVDLQGKPLTAPEVLRHVVDEAVLADQVGVDIIGLGEHHRADFSISSPETVLAAIAARTTKIRLASAVTVLSSDDPVRVYQRFATVDGISGGRAEVILGRGSFTESFPLFGYELDDYEVLFEEKLELFAALRAESAVTWSGTTRASLDGQRVYPTTAHTGGIPTWIGVGGSPESVVRAARYGFALTLAIIGGEPARFAPYVELFNEALDKFGHEPQKVSVHSPGHIADTDDEAKNQLWPHYEKQFTRIGKERGWPPPNRARFEQDTRVGSLYVGSPETVARRIAATIKALGIDRFELKYGNGELPHEHLMRSVELFGTKVIPRVRELLAEN